nr:hypothetical protein 4 [Candidatus Omnitrophota bacterium]
MSKQEATANWCNVEERCDAWQLGDLYCAGCRQLPDDHPLKNALKSFETQEPPKVQKEPWTRRFLNWLQGN